MEINIDQTQSIRVFRRNWSLWIKVLNKRTKRK
jgi:hypothetical protein